MTDKPKTLREMPRDEAIAILGGSFGGAAALFILLALFERDPIRFTLFTKSKDAEK